MGNRYAANPFIVDVGVVVALPHWGDSGTIAQLNSQDYLWPPTGRLEVGM